MTIDLHETLQPRLIPTSDLILPDDPRGYASVLVPLIQIDSDWHVLLTLRSSELRHHGGEVAFPGGMWEEGDDSPIDIALRESEEEIDLPLMDVNVLGGLEEHDTRILLTRVRPVVGIISDMSSLQVNEEEIETIFTVPLEFFQTDQRLRTDIFGQAGTDNKVKRWVPAYQYQQYEIWGLTAAVIVQLMNRCFSANLTRENNAPEKIW